MYLEHLYTRPNTEAKTTAIRDIKIWGFGAVYIRSLTVLMYEHINTENQQTKFSLTAHSKYSSYQYYFAMIPGSSV